MIAHSLAARMTMLQALVAAAVVVLLAGSSLLLTQRVLIRAEDQFLEETAKRIAGNIDREYREERDVGQAVAAALVEETVTGVRIDVTGPDGRMAATSSRMATGPPRATAGIRQAAARAECGAVVTISVSNRLLRTALKALGQALLLPAIPVLFASFFLSRSIARRGLRPLAEMGHRAQDASVERGVRSLGAPTGLTEIDGLREAFDRLLVRLDDLLQSERRFTSDASHELRTPLTVLSGEIEMALAERGLSPAVREGLDRALDQVRAMRDLVEALLLMRRADPAAPEARSDFEPVNLSDLLDEIVSETGRREPERARDIGISAPDEALVAGHPALLSSALRNLVDNALKFTHAGEMVRIAIAAVDSGETGGEVTVTIDDAGPGIPIDERERIFDPFYRGAEARAERCGFGLGLPILRQVVGAHGGSVKVGPSSLGGAQFLLRLPGWKGR